MSDDPTLGAAQPRPVEIRGDMIRLGQLLKLAGMVDGGGEAKELLARGGVLVNGELELRRGRQLRVGDVVVVEGDETLVVAALRRDLGPAAHDRR